MSNIIKITDTEYFDNPAVNKSLLARIDCPKKARLPRPDTKAFLEGRVIHCAALEPEAFDARYIVSPKIDKRTKAGKEKYAAFVDEAGDREVLAPELYDTALSIQKAVYGHSGASELLQGGKAEMAAFWKDERTGLDMKAKADYLNTDIIDLKTTRDASPGSFSKDCANYLYGWQAVYYMRGFERDDFVFIVVEKTPPFVVECYRLDEASLDVARWQLDDAIDKYKMCVDFDDWDAGYTGEEIVHTIGLPTWAMK